MHLLNELLHLASVREQVQEKTACLEKRQCLFIIIRIGGFIAGSSGASLHHLAQLCHSRQDHGVQGVEHTSFPILIIRGHVGRLSRIGTCNHLFHLPEQLRNSAILLDKVVHHIEPL